MYPNNVVLPLLLSLCVVALVFIKFFSRPMEQHIKQRDMKAWWKQQQQGQEQEKNKNRKNDSTTADELIVVVRPYSSKSSSSSDEGFVPLKLTPGIDTPSKGELIFAIGGTVIEEFATKLAYSLGVRRLPEYLSLDELAPPPTKAVEDATALCRNTVKEKEWIFQHSMRTYLFGAAMAYQLGIAFDKEVLFVAALCHDLAFVKPYDRDDTTFELLSAKAGYDFALEHNMTQHQAAVIHEMIALHTMPHRVKNLDPEVALVSRGAFVDVGGSGREDIWHETRQDILTHHPRCNFKQELCALVQDHVTRKPWSPLAVSCQLGFLYVVNKAPYDE